MTLSANTGHGCFDMGEGLASFQRRMAAIPADVKEGVRPALMRAADLVADTVQRLVPVDQGDLRASVNVTGPNEVVPAYAMGGGERVAESNEAIVSVGNSNVRYPHLIEYGTKTAPAQPYFWPSVKLTEAKVRRIVRAGISKSIKRSKK